MVSRNIAFESLRWSVKSVKKLTVVKNRNIFRLRRAYSGKRNKLCEYRTTNRFIVSFTFRTDIIRFSEKDHLPDDLIILGTLAFVTGFSEPAFLQILERMGGEKKKIGQGMRVE